jgi:hypothetical protein
MLRFLLLAVAIVAAIAVSQRGVKVFCRERRPKRNEFCPQHIFRQFGFAAGGRTNFIDVVSMALLLLDTDALKQPSNVADLITLLESKRGKGHT